MSNSFFRFKQFTVWHDKCAMKVGTDGVLLGVWTDVRTARNILDVGTGTGLVALMLAQRCPQETMLTALEIDRSAICQARENVASSPWKERVTVVEGDFRNYRPEEKYDVIVSNPPYFVDSLACPDDKRRLARHNDSLTYEELLDGVSHLLSDTGGFTLILPADVSKRVKEMAAGFRLYPSKELQVITKPGGISKRSLLTFTDIKQKCETTVLLTEVARHQYSEAFVALAKAYYLHL